MAYAFPPVGVGFAGVRGQDLLAGIPAGAMNLGGPPALLGGGHMLVGGGQQPQPPPPGTAQGQQCIVSQPVANIPQAQQPPNPATNDAPLEFNVNKNKPPMPVVLPTSGNGNGSVSRNSSEPNSSNTSGGTGTCGDRPEEGNGRSGGGSRSNSEERRSGGEQPREKGSRRRGGEGERGMGSERNRDRGRFGRNPSRSEESRPNNPPVSGASTPSSKSSPIQQQANPQPPPPPPPSTAMQGAVAAGMAPGPMFPGGPGGMMGMGYVMGVIPGAVMADPSLMGMGQFGMMGGLLPENAMAPGPPAGATGPLGVGGPPLVEGTAAATGVPPATVGMEKEVIHCKSCTLFPPNPGAPPPRTRERPPGCRTVFVGGLPENATEELIQEVFERCGEITTIRMSKKNFCHIRFQAEQYVEMAIYLSGYRIRMNNAGPEVSNVNAVGAATSPATGRLHVDYAQARDDLYEWECRQRQVQREARHRQRLEQERLRPPSPPPVVHYTDHEAQAVAERIKVDESFMKGVQTVVTWLERGDCSKRNANHFYSMIQSTNSHVRRLMSEKASYEEELAAAKDLMKQRMQGILMQFGQIERVFVAASHQKVWDHFTKAQRKNIDMWRKQAAEIKSMQLEEVLNERADEEMEVSDSDMEADSSGPTRRKFPRMDEDAKAIESLKEENDSLRCQLEAYKNEVDLVRSDSMAEVALRDQQTQLLKQTLQGMQQQLLEAKRKQAEDERALKDLEARLAKATSSGGSPLSSSAASSSTDGPSGSGCGADDGLRVADPLTERDARLIGLVSTFLHVHPFGAGVDYVWSYLQKIEPSLRPSDVEALLSRFPSLFRQELSGIGANMERKWLFAGFSRPSSLHAPSSSTIAVSTSSSGVVPSSGS
ncbi:ecto-NOX disulfide-thiol exchanger 2 isoform X2 [Ischnura elegans]|uniref:ecto-NOX disulfide-thiol exchanger 2 isoform X2 n=1 Tax=Ischnura elegans TaxID=197161 RepID=UPI001ED8A9F4|nr:ecto-NOX disulfide-thiol exchanger 2 isoform X2 [Ischnura elegans]